MSKLKEIAEKKAEMKGEGEKLSEERKKLEEEIKKKGRTLSIREKRELEQKYRSSTIRLKNLMKNSANLKRKRELC